MEKLLIVDGHNLLFRMFYGIPGTIKNSKDVDIKATFGFVGGIIKYVKRFTPDKIIVVFDSETSITENRNDYEDYKSNRIDYSVLPDEENPFTQLPYIIDILNHLQVTNIEVQGNEADDYIASLCKKYRNENEIVIVSTDQDFFQLVDENVSVYNPRGKDGVLYTPEKVYEKFGVHPEQIIDYKVLVGDNSDNIKGVKGIGPKTAVKILSCGSIECILNKEVIIEDKLLKKLEGSIEIINRNNKLITMKNDLSIDIDECKFNCNVNPRDKSMDVLKASGIY